MSRSLKAAFILEMLILFSPVLFAGLATPTLIGSALAQGVIPGLIALLFAVAGGAGLYTTFRLAAHVVDPKRALPPPASVFVGAAAGAAAAGAGILQGLSEAPIYSALFAAPIFGMIHLLWLCRRALGPHAQA